MNQRKTDSLLVTAAPHTRSGASTREIMTDVVIALAPAAVMGAYYFGFRAVAVMLAAIASAVLFELLYELIMKRPVTIGDMSAVVTGILLAFNLPANAPLWVPIVGSAFAIVVVKQLFGGIGQNFVNPALAARAFLLTAYPAIMTDYGFAPRVADAVSSATPLSYLAEGGNIADISLVNAAIGQIGGCIGETCAPALVLGGVYLLARRVINWRIPTMYIGVSALLFLVFGRAGLFTATAHGIAVELLTGGLLIGAIFMATDYSSSPISGKGQIVFGIGCALLTVIIRLYGGYPEGVSFAILLMNLTVPLIDRFTRPKVYGRSKGLRPLNKKGGGKVA